MQNAVQAGAGQPIRGDGSGAPSPLSLLSRHFGYDRFRPLQEEAIGSVLAGRDAVVLMPTGGGKSLCYQLPALALDGTSLVISPLIALMKDQVDALRARGIAARCLNSSLTADEARLVREEVARGEVSLLYVAPERLATSGFARLLERVPVALLAVDEAHCISQWGHEFRPDYRNLGALRERFPRAPCVALTATATERVRREIASELRMDDPEFFVDSFNRPNLTYRVRPKRRSFDLLVELLREHEGESCIVYCLSRRETESVAGRLAGLGFRAIAYHAGLEPGERRDAQDRFASKDALIVVATIAFGMGIDMPDLRLVAHYNLPKSVEGYYQETGRAGRDGQPSECVLFFSYADRAAQQRFIQEIEDPGERRRARERLDRMIAYCELTSCRRRYLLDYFSDPSLDGVATCGGCDVCLGPDASGDLEEYDATEIAQKILSAVVRTGQRFGMAHVVAVLRGSRAKRVLELGHDRLSVHGIARGHREDELRDAADELGARNLLRREGERGFPTVSLTPAGWTFLRNRESLTLTRPTRAPAAGNSGSEPPDAASTASAASGAEPPEPDPALFETLRTLRLAIAREENLPAFMIFSNATLREIAAQRPASTTELGRIHGIGPAKIEKYGARFLAALASHPPDPVAVAEPAATDEASAEQGPAPPHHPTAASPCEPVSPGEPSDRDRGSEGRDVRNATPPRRTAALLVIGNEILSGKIADTNTRLLARLLRNKGVSLRRVVTIPDEPDTIAAEVAALSGAHDFVFTSGGVGATHDDVTMEGVARAFGTPVVHHPRFLATLRERGLEATHRDLARVPEGCELREGASGAWPVPVMRNVWILPGLPPVFERKLEILAECIPDGPAYFAQEELVPRPEEELIPLLDRLVAAWPTVQIGSYPGSRATRITFDGDDEKAVADAARELRGALEGRFGSE